MKSKILFSVMILAGTYYIYSQVPPPVLQQGEYWTQLFSAAYDFQSDGSIRYIVQNPANPNGLCAILMAQQDSSSSFGTGRFVYYSYSPDGGRNWTKRVIDTSYQWGFPCIATRNGIPVIAMHTTLSTGQRGHAFTDASFGTSTFTEITGFPSGISVQWPHITATTNGNLIYVGSLSPPGADSYYSYYNGTSWASLIPLQNISGPSGQFSTESGPSGQVYILGTNNFTGVDDLKLFTSSNNGTAFILQTGSNAPPSFITSGLDTLYAYIDGGKSGIYLGSEPHLVYSVYASNSEVLPSPPNTAWFKKTKIIHWSPSTGIDTVAGRYNMPGMTDTLTHSLVTPLCQPSMGYYNGYIYVIYTAFLRGNNQTVLDGSIVNAGEIFITRSSDNGNTWSAPVNITNTPNIEEKHPSAVRNFVLAGSDSVGVFYLRDLKAGGWVNVVSWGKAPVYGIYKKVGPDVLGIKQDLEAVREYKLFQNYPNPFNPATTISYNLQKASFVTLKIYNVLGEEVRVLINEEQRSGAKEVSFDAGNLPSGVYFYTLTAGDFRDTKSMVLLK